MAEPAGHADQRFGQAGDIGVVVDLHRQPKSLVISSLKAMSAIGTLVESTTLPVIWFTCDGRPNPTP